MPSNVEVMAKIDALTRTPVDDEERVKAAEFIRKHAGEDAPVILECLGLAS